MTKGLALDFIYTVVFIVFPLNVMSNHQGGTSVLRNLIRLTKVFLATAATLTNRSCPMIVISAPVSITPSAETPRTSTQANWN